MGSNHELTIIVPVFFYWLQPYALRPARMEVPVQLQIAAPAVVGGLGALAVKVCDSMYDQKYIVFPKQSMFLFSFLERCRVRGM